MFTSDYLDEMFYEMMDRDGYDAWWECEAVWEEYETEMVRRGVSPDEAAHFFSILAWEL